MINELQDFLRKHKEYVLVYDISEIDNKRIYSVQIFKLLYDTKYDRGNIHSYEFIYSEYSYNSFNGAEVRLWRVLNKGEFLGID